MNIITGINHSLYTTCKGTSRLTGILGIIIFPTPTPTTIPIGIAIMDKINTSHHITFVSCFLFIPKVDKSP